MSVKKEDYVSPEKYQEHLLEQYKLYVEMADRISQRRMTTNAFFIPVHAFLVTISAVFGENKEDKPFLALLSLFAVGIFISVAWYCLLDSYRKLNTGKFKVVHEMEALLPFAPYDVEWDKLGRGERPALYRPLSHLEVWLPIAFIIVYSVLLVCLIAPYAWELFQYLTSPAV